MSGKPGQAKGDAEDQSRSWSWFAFSGAAPASTGGAGAEPRKTIGELPQGRKEAARSVPAKGGAADASSSPAVGFRSSSAALPGGRDSDSGWHRAVDSSPEADTDEAERPRSSSVSGAGEAMELGEVVVHDEAEGADGRLRLVVESSRAAASASPQEGSRDGIGAGAPAQSAAGSADATSAAASGAGGSAAGAAAAAPASGEPAASTSSSYLSGSMLAVLRNVGLASAPPAPSKQPAATSGAKAAKDAPSAAGTRHQAAPPAERPAQPSAPPAGTGDSIAEYGALMDLHRAELKRDGFTLSFRKQSRPRLVPALRVPGAKPSKPAGTVAISDPDSQAAPKAPKTQRTLLQSVFWAGPPTSDVSSPGPAGGMHAAGLHNRLRHSARPMADMLAGGDGRHGRGLSILAMDGGGIKGLVTLESLRQIERHTGRRIHELFDLIGGTSTGGLLAMLVGVKRMPLDDIPAIYETIRDKLASATGVFSELHRFASGVIYDDKMTADLLSGILGEGRLDEVPAWPKAFVVASACNSTPAQPYLFRTYELTRAASASSEFLGTSNCLMWEAVRATSSAPTFYNPAVVGGQRFVDGGILANNPAVIALAEAAVIWPHASVSCVVSLGTGMPSSRVHTARSALEWISYIVTDLCLSSHITHAVASSLLGDGQYFRVDPPMVDVSLSEVNKDVLAKMIDSVRAFLEQEPQQRLFRRVARILTARKPRMAAAPGVTQHCAASAAGARDSAAARSAPAGGNAAAAAAAAPPPMSPLMAVASVGETPTPLDDAAASAAGLEADGVKPVFPEPAGAAAEAATTAPAERPPAAAPGTESAGKPAARSAQGGEATAQPGSPDSLAESPRSPASATRQQAASSSAAEDASQPAPPAKGTGSPGAV
ncbi:hypothetical protein FNF28_01813 [Cafeteria roenbergensis]|uniref:PNPLA domain-containing protein n=1 Tax=Cafeteria roenbergensis TaxID=33653 RepID=A0A5A8DWK7_CAFRO|nr:hypothetical protein FNF28_01813 [Cafeteria roenbergensis]